MKVYKLKHGDSPPLIVSKLSEGLEIMAIEIENDPSYVDAWDGIANHGHVMVSPPEVVHDITITICEMPEEVYKNLPEWEP